MHRSVINWSGVLIASAPFLLGSSYEAYVLTPMYGPQMIGFIVAHTYLALIVLPSALVYAASLLYATVALLIELLRRGATSRRVLWLALYLGIGALHCGLLSTYDKWSPLFEQR